MARALYNTVRKPEAYASRPAQGSHVWLFSLWGVMMIVLSIIWPRFAAFNPDSPLKLTPYTIMALLTWPLMLLHYAMYRSWWHSLFQASKTIGRPLMVFAAWLSWRLLANVFGVDPAFSFTTTLREYLYLLAIIPACLMISVDHEIERRIPRILIVCTLFVLGMALLESSRGMGIAEIFNIRISIEQLNDAVTLLNERLGVARIRSVFIHPIVFAQYLCIAAPFLLHAALWEKRRLFKLFALCAIALSVWGVLSTGSRAGQVAFGFSLISYLAFRLMITSVRARRQSALLAFLGLSIMISLLPFAIIIGSQIGAGTSEVEAASNSARLYMMERGFNAANRSPLFGYGEGLSIAVAGLIGANNIATIDSAPMSALVDFGWPGLFLMLATWLVVPFGAMRVALRSKHAGQASFAIALLASSLSFCMVQVIISLNDNVSLFYMIAALTLICAAGQRRDSRTAWEIRATMGNENIGRMRSGHSYRR